MFFLNDNEKTTFKNWIKSNNEILINSDFKEFINKIEKNIQFNKLVDLRNQLKKEIISLLDYYNKLFEMAIRYGLKLKPNY